MERIESILFPVDFSDHCRMVAPAVAAMARRFGAEVVLLHALDMPSGAYSDWQAFLNLVDIGAFQRHASRRLDHFLVEEMKGVPVRRALADGLAARSIVEYARAHGSDLIMLPSRGLSPFRAFLMGSVTERVLHDAACPVWTEAHIEAEVTPPLDYKSVLCAIDLSHASAGVLRWAQRMASEYHAALHVIHVSREDWPEVRAFQSETYARLAAEGGVSAELEVASGPVANTVHAAAVRHQSDLLVIGRGHLTGAFGRLRTRAHAIIRGSHCAVLSV